MLHCLTCGGLSGPLHSCAIDIVVPFPPITGATGVKHDSGKEPLDLIPSEALFQLAKVLQYGATKYASHNWRGGLKWSRVFAAVQRHLLKWNAGQTNDEETGLNHLAHAMCGIAFLLEYANTKPELDDRYKPEGGK